MLITGISTFFNPFDLLSYLPEAINKFLSSSSIDLIFAAITILVINELNERRANRLEMEELILQMGSPNNTIAVEAARKLKRYKSQERQDRIDQLSSEEREHFPDDAPIWLSSLHGLWLVKANLSKADLTRLDLSEARLDDAELVEVDLSQSCLSNAHLKRANLCKAILFEANLVGAYLREAKLTKANLSGATLDKAQICKANLEDANLQNATFIRTDLSDANLSGADLQGANFEKADLFKANLSETNLRGATFFKADLSSTNLSNAQLGLPRRGFAPPNGWGDRTSFSEATYNDDTIWPDDINPSEYGAKKDT